MLRTISYGGGVQSSALCVLATQGKLGHVDAALFANVGDDSEHPDTLRYVREIMIPWAAERGLEVHEVHKTKNGRQETLWGRLTAPTATATTIPVRGETGAPQARHCTVDFKIKPVAAWHKARGATADNKATVLIGISTDEYHRATTKSEPWQVKEYPLIDLGLNRADCAAIIKDAGLPVPRKSSCFFCPWHSAQSWAEMRRDEPGLFAASAGLEAMMAERGIVSGERPVYLTDRGAATKRRLASAIPTAQDQLFATESAFNDGECDEGYCWT